MICSKCGMQVEENSLYCTNCGNKIERVNNSNNTFDANTFNMNNINQDVKIKTQKDTEENLNVNDVNSYFLQNYNNEKSNSQSKNSGKTIFKILAIIGGFIISIVIIFVAIYSLVSINSSKLVCKSNEGNITIMYNKDGLTGYKTSGMTYNFDEQSEYAKKIGVDAYLKEFNSWFLNNTTGKCRIDGKQTKGVYRNDM